jgi:hypothetical protein
MTAPTATTRWDAKDPADIVDYFLNWATLPLPAGATITTSTVTLPAVNVQPAATPPYALLTKSADDYAGTIQRVRLAGGVPGNSYPIDLMIDTSDGQQFKITKTLAVKERTK